MTAFPPGFNLPRLVDLMRAAVRRCELDLSGAAVLTEAASGAYLVTPVLAALAGARQVVAVTRSTRYGSAEEITAQTEALARLAGVAGRLRVTTDRAADFAAEADVITNAGHVRPIDAAMVRSMKPTAVIPLMYEAWEFRPGDVDLDACRERGVAVAGTNERHPAVDVFGYLGIMAVKLLLDAGVAVRGSRVLLLCDNPFRPHIVAGLEGAGAEVVVDERLRDTAAQGTDAVLVALKPGPGPVLDAAAAARIGGRMPGAVVAQFWGDVDRAALAAASVPVWPAEAPRPGHMGILPSGVGPEPIVRLQAGGLKVGEVLWRLRRSGATPAASLAGLEASGYGTFLPVGPQSAV